VLNQLHILLDEISRLPGLPAVLDLIVSRIRPAFGAEVCSVYLNTRGAFVEPELALAATSGFASDRVGQVRLKLSEGIVGLVAQRGEVINLAHGGLHPRFKQVQGLDESGLKGFVGVPLLHRGQLKGVLVVQRSDEGPVSEESVAFLTALAIHVAALIQQAELAGEPLPQAAAAGGVRRFAGIPGSPGIALGTAVSVDCTLRLEAVPDLPGGETAVELARLNQAIAATLEELNALAREFGPRLPHEEQLLFEAWSAMLHSESLVLTAEGRIRAGAAAETAWARTVLEHVAVFEEISDPYLRERAQDVYDLGQRVLQRLRDQPQRSGELPERIVLVGSDIAAAHFAEFPLDRVVGLVSGRGSNSSHIALLARALGIPAMMGAGDLAFSRFDRHEVILDGYQGVLMVSPDAVLKGEYQRLARQEDDLMASLDALRDLPAVSPDGARVSLQVNAGLQADLTPSLRFGAEGVGLYRTEIPFLVRKSFPDEAEQVEIYRRVLAAYAPRPVVLRTLDVGGDKPLPYLPLSEENPFLGWRGIRLTLDHPEMFRTQLRAMLRADVGLGNLSILLPMVANVSELDDTITLLDELLYEMEEQGIAVRRPPLGVMIEVPSSLFIAHHLATRVQFFSVGTNDLTQYLLAVDRNNERVASLYDSFNPAVLRAVAGLVAVAREARRPVSVCGELAGDPLGALCLFGLGIESLSMSASSLPRVKWVIRTVPQREARRLTELALLQEDAGSVRALLREGIEQYGLGGVIHAGSH